MPNLSYLNKTISTAVIIFAGVLTLALFSIPADAKIYKWTDDKGKVHFTDSPAKIPKEYREKKDGIETLEKGPADPDNPVEFLRAERTPRVIEIPLENRGGDSFAVNVLLNGQVRAKLILDTGASMVTLSSSIGDQLGIKAESMPQMPFTTAGGTVMSPILTLRSVKAGEAVVQDVQASINPNMGGLDGLLGMSFLGEYKIEVDRSAPKLVLKPLIGRGEQAWDGKNAGWWKERLGKYAGESWNYSQMSDFLKKSKPSQSREMKKLADYYKDLYFKLEDRAQRAGIPKDFFPEEASKIKN